MIFQPRPLLNPHVLLKVVNYLKCTIQKCWNDTSEELGNKHWRRSRIWSRQDFVIFIYQVTMEHLWPPPAADTNWVVSCRWTTLLITNQACFHAYCINISKNHQQLPHILYFYKTSITVWAPDNHPKPPSNSPTPQSYWSLPVLVFTLPGTHLSEHPGEKREKTGYIMNPLVLKLVLNKFHKYFSPPHGNYCHLWVILSLYLSTIHRLASHMPREQNHT